MKKIFLIMIMLLCITGCGNKEEEKYDYKCTKSEETENYKSKTTLKIGFDGDKVFKFYSEIKEEHSSVNTANDAYMTYQSKYDGYNENHVDAEYKKDGNNITVTYTMDKSDIDNVKIPVSYDFGLEKQKFIESLEKDGFECKK